MCLIYFEPSPTPFRYGEIVSLKLLMPRRCAFVNFQKASSAAQALEQLQVRNLCRESGSVHARVSTVQGYHLGGNYLLLRYPEMSNKNPYMLK